MSTTYNLGRIGMNICGEYNATTNYEKLDVVSYEGGSYVAKVASNNILPTEGNHWMQLAKGETDIIDYSTDEILTNMRWIDGRPIYQRVYSASITMNVIKEVGTIENLGSVVEVRGMLHTGTNTWISADYFYSTSAYAYTRVQSSVVKAFSKCYNGTVYVMVQYTKSTD